MTDQQFLTTDVVRLEVQEGWPDLPNLVPNPSGESGAWGWSCTSSWTLEQTAVPSLLVKASASQMFRSVGAFSDRAEIQRVTASDDLYVRAWITVDEVSAPPVGQLGAGLNVNARSAVTGISNPIVPHNSSTEILGPGTYEFPPVEVPVDSDAIRLALYLPAAVGGVQPMMKYRNAILIMGTLDEVTASDPFSEPGWINVIGSTNKIDTERDELDAGFLNATIFDSALDPASTDLIRPGKRCRMLVLVDGVWEPIFTGLLDNPSTAYLVDDPNIPDTKRAQVQLVANDPAATLAAEPRPNGVGTIDELPAVLLGCGVPWNVNGSTATIDPGAATVVAVNESASALDQVAITRDTAQGYAWVDRTGTVQAWDAADLGAVVVDTLDETTYSRVDPDFDIARLINDVVVNLSRINPGTGETEEIQFGPYISGPSIREWRRRRAEFRIQGIDEALVPDYAAAILAANATPAKRINEVTLPLRTIAEVEAHALRDLYDLVAVSNERAGISGQQSRVTSVKHSLIATPSGAQWSMTLGFATEGTVAVPQVTPAPGPTGRTLGQLLRPVGEVTMWFGAKADIPAGWLALDGDEFDGDAFPELAALLGDTTLPDFTDRFPIGAGTKALGTTGGDDTVTLTAANLPPHTHQIERSAGANTGGGTDVALGNTSPAANGATEPSTGTSAPFSVLNPWLSLWFIVRAA